MTAGGVSASRVAKWDGATWSALGSGIDNAVRVLAVFDDGTGPALFAGGDFTSAGGVSASRIAKWDGTSWTTLGSGMNGWELAAQVCAYHAGVRFCLATGWGTQIDTAEAAARGVEAVVAKPYRLTDLQRVVAALLPE